MMEMTVLLTAYKEAAEKYHKEHTEYTQKVCENKLADSDEEPQAPPKPVNRIKDYDFYLDVLKQNETDSVILNENLFKKLWNDRWDWTRTHYNSLMFYARAGGTCANTLETFASGYESGDFR